MRRRPPPTPISFNPSGPLAQSNIEAYYSSIWRNYGTADGALLGAPLGASVKSFVWYSPSMLAEGGYETPATLDDLYALTDLIATSDVAGKPWCVGIESGDSTGWAATDWLEDMMLRTAGGDAYDQWVTHEIAFDGHR